MSSYPKKTMASVLQMLWCDGLAAEWGLVQDRSGAAVSTLDCADGDG
jgi:hypothetical protein